MDRKSCRCGCVVYCSDSCKEAAYEDKLSYKLPTLYVEAAATAVGADPRTDNLYR